MFISEYFLAFQLILCIWTNDGPIDSPDIFPSNLWGSKILKTVYHMTLLIFCKLKKYSQALPHLTILIPLWLVREGRNFLFWILWVQSRGFSVETLFSTLAHFNMSVLSYILLYDYAYAYLHCTFFFRVLQQSAIQ